MKLVVVGRKGQIARSLLERKLSSRVEIECIGRPELDLLAPSGVFPSIAASQPDVIVNAAAYTAVDAAESDQDAAFAVNAIGAGAVATAAAQLGVPIIHLSTDYVFDGQLDRPYRETDQTAPLSVYGKSKLAGELAVAEANRDHAIVRIGWVYSPFGPNFVRTMLRLAHERPEIAVVADQHGTPGNSFDVADGIIAIARNLHGRPEKTDLRGTFHMAAPGETSWAGFAESICAAATEFGLRPAHIRHIATSDYPTAASRPANSRLSARKLSEIHGIQLPHWQMSLRACVERILRPKQNEGGSL